MSDNWKEKYEERKIHESFDKELRECSEKGVEISQECKTYFKKKFQHSKNNKADYIDENK